MDWCSYFRLRDGQQFGTVRLEVEQESKLANYKPFAPLSFQVDGAAFSVASFYNLSFPTAPTWLDFLTLMSGQSVKDTTPGRGHSALIVAEWDGHIYLLAFGMAHTIAKKLTIERRFGKIVVGNGKYEDEVRGIKAKVHGEAGKTRIERRGRGGPLGELEMPRRANMASALDAKMSLGNIDHVASGDSSIRTVAPADVDQAVEYLTTLEGWWNGGVELDPAIAALDRIVEIHEAPLIGTLETTMTGDLKSANDSKFSLCLDDDELWEATSADYFLERKRYPLGSFEEAHILGALKKGIDRGEDPLLMRYEADIPTRKAPCNGRLHHNLAYETQVSGETDTFIFESGGWFQARASWKQQVVHDLSTLTSQSVTLLQGIEFPPPTSAKETEDSYIDRFMNSKIGTRAIKMHKVFPPNMRQIELCDLCIDERVLVFVKRGSDRASCGDVTQQALNSANALADNDPAFRNWANTKLSAKNWKIDDSRRPDYVLCVLLITGKPSRINDYTTRAMDALSGHLREIQKLSYRAAIVVV